MNTFYERLVAEKEELDIKLDKLHSFLESDKINNLPSQQVSLLHIQASIMAAYSQILLERIALINVPV